MPSDLGRIKDLFLAAADLPVAERPAFLAASCGTDPVLRRRVEVLLAAHDQEAGPLGPPPPADGTVTIDASHAPEEAVGHPPQALRGAVLAGRYKLLEPIGAGGMGTVWMAEQMAPIKRLVALKLIKPGMDSDQVLARFEAERQALARMDHPNIARVLDGGTTAEGRPYFVMELVKGVPITTYCDEHGLSARQRLELFLPVCQAVQHAHQKGVIHRDLKPSNVLVALYDEQPVPKVIDFGIAKATGEALTERTLHTGFGTVIGTPEYMSPEQATFNQLDVDTRTDVYSLGVLLYELLTGSPPFRRSELQKAGLLEMLRVVREVDPPRPSLRRTQIRNAERGTRTAIGVLHSDFPVPNFYELDWIVMKALEKDRARRYETASGLAGDVRRFLDGDPVQAVPPSVGYRLRKAMGRNRKAVLAASVIVLALIVGVCGTTWQAIRATRAERQATDNAGAALTARDEADRHALAARTAAAAAERLAEQRRVELYPNRINLAWHAWEEGDVNRMRELLDSLVPAAGQVDLRGFEWHYLNRLARHRDQTFHHPHPIRSLAVSPDGKTLATASPFAHEVWLWDVPSGRVRARLTAGGPIWTVAFAPNGREVAAGCDDGTVRTWDPESGTAGQVLHMPGKSIGSLVYSPDGTRLAAAVGTWTFKGGNPITRFLPEGYYKGPNPIVIWDTRTWEEVTRLPGHPQYVFCLAFRPGGKELASGGTGGGLLVWDLETGKARLTLKTDHQAVFAAAYSPDGTTLATAGWDMQVYLRNATTGRESQVLPGSSGPIFALAFTPDGKVLLSGGYDRLVRGWPMGHSREYGRSLGHTGPVTGLAFSTDGRTLFSAGWDGDVHAWPGNHPQQCARLTREDPAQGVTPSYHTAFSPDSRLLAATTGNNIVLFDVASRHEVRQLSEQDGDLSVAFRPDGKELAAAGMSGIVHRWQTSDWSALPDLRAHTTKIWGLAYSPDSRFLATGAGQWNVPGEVKVWDTGFSELIRNHNPQAKTVRSIAFGDRGRTVLFGVGDRVGRLDLDTGVEVQPRTGVFHVAASPDGRFEALGVKPPVGEVSEIDLWDVAAGQVTARLRGHTTTIYQAAFAADGKTLATASWDGTVKLWHVATGAELLTIRRPGGIVWTVAFSPDNRYLAIGSGTRGWAVDQSLWDARPPGER